MPQFAVVKSAPVNMDRHTPPTNEFLSHGPTSQTHVPKAVRLLSSTTRPTRRDALSRVTSMSPKSRAAPKANALIRKQYYFLHEILALIVAPSVGCETLPRFRLSDCRRELAVQWVQRGRGSISQGACHSRKLSCQWKQFQTVVGVISKEMEPKGCEAIEWGAKKMQSTYGC